LKKRADYKETPDETFDAFKERVSRLSKLPQFANNEMSLGNPSSVPNMISNNDKILKLLDDKDVNVGKFADFLSGKTAGIILNSKEETIQNILNNEQDKLQHVLIKIRIL
jgi:hypothetical protein